MAGRICVQLRHTYRFLAERYGVDKDKHYIVHWQEKGIYWTVNEKGCEIACTSEHFEEVYPEGKIKRWEDLVGVRGNYFAINRVTDREIIIQYNNSDVVKINHKYIKRDLILENLKIYGFDIVWVGEDRDTITSIQELFETIQVCH